MSKGRPPVFETPSDMWAAFKQYETETKANPRLVRVFVGWAKRPEWLRKQVPLTFSGFEVWLWQNGKGRDLGNYMRQKCAHHEQFEDVLKRIRICCHADMLEGAMVGIYDARIVARLLSL